MYSYQIGSHEPVRSFRAAAEPSPDAGFTFVVYGDMGESEHPRGQGARVRAQLQCCKRTAGHACHACHAHSSAGWTVGHGQNLQGIGHQPSSSYLS